jgi:DNA-binding transcriptional LysR family regulator
VLTPDALDLLQRIADCGSFAAAARRLGMVPSALTYRVRRLEDALDVLLFDRSSRQARLTAAGAELLREGARLLADIDAVALRVRRVATGWEAQFTIAADSIVDRRALLTLCADFFALTPPTRLKLRHETLSGTLEALTSGQADLALGIVAGSSTMPGLQTRPLGTEGFVFAVAPHHPLARAPEPLSDELLRGHRVVAVADSVQRGQGLTVGLLAGQDVFTVPDMPTKLEAQLRGLGTGTLPICLAQPYIDTGRLVARRLERPAETAQLSYGWRQAPAAERGKALQWWLARLETPETRRALLGERHG